MSAEGLYREPAHREDAAGDEKALRERMEALQLYLDTNRFSKDTDTEPDKDELRRIKDTLGIPYTDY